MINQPILNQLFFHPFFIWIKPFSIFIFTFHYITLLHHIIGVQTHSIPTSHLIYIHVIRNLQPMKQVLSKCNHKYSTITKKLKTYQNNEKNNKIKPKQRKKTHLFSWKGKSSIEITLKNLKTFSRHKL